MFNSPETIHSARTGLHILRYRTKIHGFRDSSRTFDPRNSSHTDSYTTREIHFRLRGSLTDSRKLSWPKASLIALVVIICVFAKGCAGDESFDEITWRGQT